MYSERPEEILRLLQLCSPTLPVGAYAYSQGLEFAVSSKWVFDETSTSLWIQGLLENSLTYLDVPILSRLYDGWSSQDKNEVLFWNDFLFANRDSKEIQEEEQQLAQALSRLLVDLGIAEAGEWKKKPRSCFLSLFTLGAVRWEISLHNAVLGYLRMWAENQVLVAIKLVPIGQTSGQRILSSFTSIIPNCVTKGLSLEDEEVGYTSPGQGIASALHETQYTRLFRS